MNTELVPASELANEVGRVWDALSVRPVIDHGRQDPRANSVHVGAFDGAEVIKLSWFGERPVPIMDARPSDVGMFDYRLVHTSAEHTLLVRARRLSLESSRGKVHDFAYGADAIIECVGATLEARVWRPSRVVYAWFNTSEEEAVEMEGVGPCVIHGRWRLASKHHSMNAADPKAMLPVIQLAMGMCINREYEWKARLRTDSGIALAFPVTPTEIREVFRHRDVEPGATRRSALLHWVSAHGRRARNADDELWVRKHLRGRTAFSWKGLVGTVEPAAGDQLPHRAKRSE